MAEKLLANADISCLWIRMLQGGGERILMRKLRDQRINRGRFQGFRRPLNMWAKGRHPQRTRVKAPRPSRREGGTSLSGIR